MTTAPSRVSDTTIPSNMTDQDIAFFLHTRPFRENSHLATLFTRQSGRLSAVSRGKVKRNHSRQPFVAVQAVWTGKSELKTLVSSEVVRHYPVAGTGLLVGMYLNELLMRLLHDHEGYEAVFDHYRLMVESLAHHSDIEPHLRRFEFHLLQSLGYGFSLEYEADTGDPLSRSGHYQFVPDTGFVAAPFRDGVTFGGDHLLSLAEDHWDDITVRRAAKRLMRLALAPHLGSRPLASRELFLAGDTAGKAEKSP
jgi:DNA repair protein RecO (recombination protein O)